jgi:polar amino acid transport system substrate-binding protein
VKLSPPLVTKPYYLLLSRQFVMRDPGLANAVWGAIPEVRASREFHELETLYTDGS